MYRQHRLDMEEQLAQEKKRVEALEEERETLLKKVPPALCCRVPFSVAPVFFVSLDSCR